ncbi:MAG: hypothetical protein WA771_00890, partial [Chthoniobacterales bacterium]
MLIDVVALIVGVPIGPWAVQQHCEHHFGGDFRQRFEERRGSIAIHERVAENPSARALWPIRPRHHWSEVGDKSRRGVVFLAGQTLLGIRKTSSAKLQSKVGDFIRTLRSRREKRLASLLLGTRPMVRRMPPLATPINLTSRDNCERPSVIHSNVHHLMERQPKQTYVGDFLPRQCRHSLPVRGEERKHSDPIRRPRQS